MNLFSFIIYIIVRTYLLSILHFQVLSFLFIKVIVLCLFWLILSLSKEDSFVNVFKYCLFRLFNVLIIPHIGKTYYILNVVTLTKEHFSSICMNAVEWVTFASLWLYQTLFTKYFDYYFVTNWHYLYTFYFNSIFISQLIT